MICGHIRAFTPTLQSSSWQGSPGTRGDCSHAESTYGWEGEVCTIRNH